MKKTARTLPRTALALIVANSLIANAHAQDNSNAVPPPSTQPSAILSDVPKPQDMAQNSQTIYGGLYPTLDISTSTTREYDSAGKEIRTKESKTEFHDNASRVGVRGNVGVTSDIKATYQLETRVKFDQSNYSGKDMRDTYVGLASDKYGTAKVGRLLSVNYHANQTFPSSAFPSVAWSYARFNNAISYQTPKFKNPKYADITAYAMVALNEAKDKNSFDSNVAFVGASYKKDKRNYGLSFSHLGGKGYGVAKSSVRANFSHKLNDKNSYALIAQITDIDQSSRDEMGIAGHYSHKIKPKTELFAQANYVHQIKGTTGKNILLDAGISRDISDKVAIGADVWLDRTVEPNVDSKGAPTANRTGDKTTDNIGITLGAKYSF